MKEKLQKIRERAMAQIQAAGNLNSLNDVRVAILGKKGELTDLLKSMKDVQPEERPKVGQMVNEARTEIEKLLEERERYARDFHIEEGWEKTVRGFLGERELTQGMVDAFVTRVSVDKDGDCEVVLAYDDMLAELLEAVREREAENGEG